MSCVSRTLAQSWKDTLALCVCVTVSSTSRASELTSRLGVAAHRGSTCFGKRRALSSIGSTSSWQPLHSHVGREFWLEHLKRIHELPSPRWEHPTLHGPPGRETFSRLCCTSTASRRTTHFRSGAALFFTHRRRVEHLHAQLHLRPIFALRQGSPMPRTTLGQH